MHAMWAWRKWTCVKPQLEQKPHMSCMLEIVLWNRASIHTCRLYTNTVWQVHTQTNELFSTYSNEDSTYWKRFVQRWFINSYSIPLWANFMPQRAQEQGASNATFGWSIWHDVAKLHVREDCKAFEYLEVIQCPRLWSQRRSNALVHVAAPALLYVPAAQTAEKTQSYRNQLASPNIHPICKCCRFSQYTG